MDLTRESLARWTDAGAHWRVVRLQEARAEVQLCSCLGEPVELSHTEDPELVAYLRTHRSDEDEVS